MSYVVWGHVHAIRYGSYRFLNMYSVYVRRNKLLMPTRIPVYCSARLLQGEPNKEKMYNVTRDFSMISCQWPEEIWMPHGRYNFDVWLNTDIFYDQDPAGNVFLCLFDGMMLDTLHMCSTCRPGHDFPPPPPPTHQLAPSSFWWRVCVLISVDSLLQLMRYSLAYDTEDERW